LYAFLCAIAGLLVVGVGLMRTVTHFTYKVNQYACILVRPSLVNIGQTELIQECVSFAQNGEADSVSILL
jgi:hypothetical protein